MVDTKEKIEEILQKVFYFKLINVSLSLEFFSK
jgi:hypothetical protein